MQREDLDALVQRAREGEARSLEELCRRAFRIAYQVASRRFRFEPAEAEDVAQEMVVRTLQKLPEADVNVSWIHTGAVFFCIDLLRQRQTADAGAVRFDDLRQAGAIPAPLDFADADLRLLLAALPEQCATLLRRHFIEGLSFTEIDAERGDGRRRAQFDAKKCLDLLARRLSSRRARPRRS